MLEGTRVRIKNRTYAYATIPGLDEIQARYLEFYLDKAERLIQKNVLGKQTVVPPPYDLELPTPYGQVHRRVN